MRQKLHSYVQGSARKQMYFHTGHLSEEEHDAAFWYGFHSEDCEVLWPHLIGKNPFQPSDIPFHFEDVFSKPLIVRHKQPIVEPISRDAYGFQAVTCAIASNAETTTTPNKLSPSSHPIQDTQLPSSSSPSALESQHGLVHSVTLNQPEPAYTLSTTLLPLASSLSHTLSPVHPATDNDLIPAYMFLITMSTLPPLVSPTLTHNSSLAHVAADIPEISSTPSPSIMPAPLSMPMSDFKYLPSAMVNQPKPTPMLSSTPHSSSILSTFLPSPARLAMEDQSKPESTPTLFASIPMLTSTPTHVHLATDYGTIFASTPPSSSPTSSTLLPSLVTSATDFQPKSKPTSESLVSKFGLFPRMLSFPPNQMFTPLSSSPLLEILTLGSLSVSLSPDQSIESLSFKSEALSQSSGSCELESTPTSTADIAPPPVSTDSLVELYLLLPGKLVPFLPASSETPPNAPISPHSTPPQQPPGLKIVSSDCSTLEVTPPHTLSVPQQSQELSLVYRASSVFAPHPSLIYSSDSLRCTPAHFGFTLTLITMAILSSFLNFSATLLCMHKFQSKIEDFGNSQISTLNTSSHNIFVHRLRLGQYMPCAAHFIFDQEAQLQVQFSNYSRHTKTFTSVN
ncbi:hypothetical protein EDB89DRAFT_2083156 [Lactarius sanguifluus]|nr:hypothetical protein EDB89DRAFT_2083156 [Lactarius sanguifluus]